MNPETLTWIEKQKPTLVEWAEHYVKTSELHFPKNPGSSTARVSGSQLRNLLAAAQSGSSLSILLNFLRYQMGRRQGWGHTDSGQQLEELLEKQLGPLCKKVPAEQGADAYELQAHLAAQLLGFIIRDYTYRCKLKGTRP